jgi:hypothetical protein|tara:strand:- start:2104 stop:2259 length:156 start_codon:yes stop_codon:yes gene_type:complete
MINFIIGFVMGFVSAFLVCGTALIAKDERDLKRRRLRNETGAFWHNKEVEE